MPEPSIYQARREELKRQYLSSPAPQTSSVVTNGVDHLALICSDLNATIRFYTEIMGMRLTKIVENRDEPTSTHIFLDMGGGNQLAFFDFPGLGLQPGVESIGSVQHIAISVEPAQLERIKGRLEAKGITYLGPERGVMTSIYFKDPDGIQIELIAEPLRWMDGRGLGV